MPHPVLAAACGSLPLGLRRRLRPRDLDRRHQHVQLGGAADGGRVGHLALARVLTGEHRASQDGLALGEEVGELLPGGLRRGKPLQRLATAFSVGPGCRRLEAGADHDRLPGCSGRELHTDRPAEGGALGGVVSAPLRGGQGGSVHVYLSDLQVGGRVQHQLPVCPILRGRIALAVEVHRAEQPLPDEVHCEVKVGVEHSHPPWAQRLCERRRVGRTQRLARLPLAEASGATLGVAHGAHPAWDSRAARS
mmetsp:Transcript_99093/g.305432  ORF Transcript_99093/g.305432 Transcript_99093/m.305432 type:complete len:250 (-) Transcript_99093:7-756(-)